jgi:hypothetical protein
MTILKRSCLETILFEISTLYESYLAPICDHYQEFVNLLELSHSKINKKYLNPTCNSSDLQEALEWLIKETQQHFFNRTGERYQAQVPEWISKNPDKVFDAAPNIIKALSNAKYPKNSKDNSSKTCIAVLGSSMLTLQTRMNSLKEMIKKGYLNHLSTVYLLTGMRKLFPNEISKEEEIILQKIYGTELTEACLMDYLYKKIFKKPAIIINATPCNLPQNSTKPCVRNRPNTEDTVEAFFDNIKSHTNVVFISSAPDILPQEAAISQIIDKRHPSISFEVIGTDAHFNRDSISKNDLAKAIHRRLMPFAGTLFASFERLSMIFSELNGECSINYETLSQIKMKLAKKQ